MQTDEPPPTPAPMGGSDVARPDGGRRTVVVSPDEVWSAPTPAATTAEEIRKEARRSFLGPIVTVVALSSVLLLLFLAALALLVWLRR